MSWSYRYLPEHFLADQKCRLWLGSSSVELEDHLCPFLSCSGSSSSWYFSWVASGCIFCGLWWTWLSWDDYLFRWSKIKIPRANPTCHMGLWLMMNWMGKFFFPLLVTCCKGEELVFNSNCYSETPSLSKDCPGLRHQKWQTIEVNTTLLQEVLLSATIVAIFWLSES